MARRRHHFRVADRDPSDVFHRHRLLVIGQPGMSGNPRSGAGSDRCSPPPSPTSCPDRNDHPEAAPRQPGAEQHRLGALHHWAVTEIPLEPQTRLNDPGPMHPAVPGPIRPADRRHLTARRGALRTRITHRHQLVVRDIGADPATRRLHPLLQLRQMARSADPASAATPTSSPASRRATHRATVLGSQPANSVAASKLRVKSNASKMFMISSACFMWSPPRG